MRDLTNHQRLTDAPAPFGVQQLTPRQQWFRETAGSGRWASDPTAENTRTGWSMRMAPDGTVDLIRLEAGVTGWQDLGGKGAYDVAAGRL